MNSESYRFSPYSAYAFIAICVLLFSFIPQASQAQTRFIKATITDQASQQALAFAAVEIMGEADTIRLSCNEQGRFMQAMPVGRYTLCVRYLGYQDQCLEQLLLTSGKDLELEIEMSEKLHQLKEVVVVAADRKMGANEFATLNSRSFTVAETKRYAGSLNDPARAVQSFAGVVSSSDQNNEIVIRGNSPQFVLWQLEGIEIPNPNHFAGTEGSTGGGVSMLSTNMLSNSDFLTAAFPSEFANALSGVFDLKLRKGNSDKHEFSFQLGVLGIEASAEGPMARSWRHRKNQDSMDLPIAPPSYLISYRYSTLNVLSLMGIKIGGNEIPKYQDISYHLVFPLNKNNRLSFFGFMGKSGLGNQASTDTLQWDDRSDRTEEALNQSLICSGIGYLHLFRNNGFLRNQLSISATTNGFQEDTLNTRLDPYTVNAENYQYAHLRNHLFYQQKINAATSLRIGFKLQGTSYDLYRDVFQWDEAKMQRMIQRKGYYANFQWYVSGKYQYSPSLQLTAGLNAQYLSINKDFITEARAAMSYSWRERHLFSFAVGMHSKPTAVGNLVAYYLQSGNDTIFPNTRLKTTSALHAVLGYNFSFASDFRIKSEAYVQYLYRVPVSSEEDFSILNYDEGFVNYALNNDGRGLNFGWECTLEKYLTDGYYFMSSLSLFKSQYNLGDSDWRSGRYDSRFVITALGGKEFTFGRNAQNSIALNSRLAWRGGERYTPLDTALSIQLNRSIPNMDKLFESRYPNYFRLDFSASYRHNGKRTAWTFEFNAQNIINHRNLSRYVFNPESGKIEKRYNLGIIPVMLWRIEF